MTPVWQFRPSRTGTPELCDRPLHNGRRGLCLREVGAQVRCGAVRSCLAKPDQVIGLPGQALGQTSRNCIDEAWTRDRIGQETKRTLYVGLGL